MDNFALRHKLIKGFLILTIIAWGHSPSRGMNVIAGEALYFSFMPTSALPTAPSSLLIQSPSYIDVPAGATLFVHLMRGDTLVSTSRLDFLQAFFTDRLVPPVPIASFVPLGMPTNVGQPLPGASLMAGEADLNRVAMETSQYKLLWILGSGVMGTPGRAIVTGSQVSFVDLKLGAVSAAAVVGDQKPGSVLFFNRYTSSASNPSRENTTVNLTNTNPTSSVFIRLFLINSATCQSQEVELCLAAQQTLSFQMSDLDPGVKGYGVAVATNQAGEPVQFNWLMGNTIVKQSAANVVKPFTSVLAAMAIAKRSPGALVAGPGNEAEMIFDDAIYDRLPAQVAFDGVPSQGNAANTTVVSLYRPVPNLGNGVSNPTVQITGWGTNALNQVVTTSGNLSVACYSDFAVSAFRLSPVAVAQLLPPSTTAWFAASTVDMQPLLGSQLNSGEFNGGNNARSLSLASEYRIRIPISPVACP